MTDPELTLRPIDPDEYDAWSVTVQVAFGQGPDAAIAEHERRLVEFDRTLAALETDDIVGSAAIYSFEMTVPGGSVPTAGVTWVSVLPTHRRRGLLRSMMRRQLDDIHELGREPVAALWASEAPIYGRFGYGAASVACRLKIPRWANALRPVPGSDDLVVRLADPTETLDATRAVYDHDRARRPGMFALNGPWRETPLFDPESHRRGASPRRTVVARDSSGEVRAYARFATRPGDDFGSATTGIRDLHGVDAASVAAVWRFVLDLDLTAEATTWLRPPDDPVMTLLIDARQAKPTFDDGLYIRLVDLPGALAARTYAVPVDVVLEVDDPFCPWNTGRWRLAGDPTGARCESTSDRADLQIGVRELGAAYLGGMSVVAFADAGLAAEQSPGAAGELSMAMRHEPAPWSPFIF